MTLIFDGVTLVKKGTTVLHDTTWEFSAGITALVGANGAGKTTTLNAIVGLDRVQDGEIRGPSPREVSYLPQHPRARGNPTVRQYLTFAAWVNGIGRRRIGEAVQDAMRRSDLERYSENRLRSLSGGTMQRAFVAECLVAEPSCLLLDEPTVGLDYGQVRGLTKILLEYSAEHRVIISTHDVSALEQLEGSANIVRLRDGRMTQMDSLREYADDAE